MALRALLASAERGTLTAMLAIYETQQEGESVIALGDLRDDSEAAAKAALRIRWTLYESGQH